MKDPQVVIQLSTFSLAKTWRPGVRKSKPIATLTGVIHNGGGFNCKFSFNFGHRSQLVFEDARIFDGSEPKTLALLVKNRLLDWAKATDSIPEELRSELVQSILKHDQGQGHGSS